MDPALAADVAGSARGVLVASACRAAHAGDSVALLTQNRMAETSIIPASTSDRQSGDGRPTAGVGDDLGLVRHRLDGR